MINTQEFIKALAALAKERGTSEKIIIDILKEAFEKSFHRNFDPEAELDIRIDMHEAIVEIINHTKTVVETVGRDSTTAIEISLEDALKLDKNAKVGDIIADLVDINTFTMTAANHIKQMVIQKTRELERANVFERWIDKKGTIIRATLERRGYNNSVFFALSDNKTTAVMSEEHSNPLEKFRNGTKLNVFVEDVLHEAKGPQVLVSRSSGELIKEAIHDQVPEVYDGTVEVVDISRKAGIRTKVSVKTNNMSVDPVGSIIGERGNRIIAISKLFSGEPIDIVRYSDDIKEYIASALSPAKVYGISIDERDSKRVTAIVEENNYLVAIGKRGSNAAIAAKLTKHSINIMRKGEAFTANIKFDKINIKEYNKAKPIKLAPFEPGTDFKAQIANAVDPEPTINLDELNDFIKNDNSHEEVAVVQEINNVKAVTEFCEDEGVQEKVIVKAGTAKEIDKTNNDAIAILKEIIDPATGADFRKSRTPKPKFNSKIKVLENAKEVHKDMRDHLTKAEQTAKIIDEIDINENSKAIKEIEKQLKSNSSDDDFDNYYEDDDY